MFKKIISFGILFVMSFVSLVGCSTYQIKAQDLMADIVASPVDYKAVDDKFINAAANFSLDLFKNSMSEDENSLVSPTSVLIALAMTANGADNQTLTQMETVLGGNLKLQQLNEYLYSYIINLPNEDKSHLSIANSIWFRDNNFTPNNEFLQNNADYYGASAYKSEFDSETVKDINHWVKSNTDGLIDKIIDEIPAEIIMYLINTVLFDAEWQNIYKKEAVREGEFTAFNNQKQTVEFMHSVEFNYLQGYGATGFIKPYYGNKYSFVALLPDQNTSIGQFIKSLNGETFMNILNSQSDERVVAALPKFSYDYSIEMNDALKSMGIVDAFSPNDADFSKLGSANGNIYISQVLHKAHISVDERGTKAGAVTVVAPGATSAPEYVFVTLDRPFIYAIIDNSTNLPIFMGSLLSCK